MSAAVAADAMAELRALSRHPPPRPQQHDALGDAVRQADLRQRPAGAGSLGFDGLGHLAHKQTATWASPLVAEGSVLLSSQGEGCSETSSASHGEGGGRSLLRRHQDRCVRRFGQRGRGRLGDVVAAVGRGGGVGGRRAVGLSSRSPFCAETKWTDACAGDGWWHA